MEVWLHDGLAMVLAVLITSLQHCTAQELLGREVIQVDLRVTKMDLRIAHVLNVTLVPGNSGLKFLQNYVTPGTTCYEEVNL